MPNRASSSKRAPFASQVSRPRKTAAGRTDAPETPVAIRTTGTGVAPALVDYVRKRLGFKLGKHARHIERVSVRFEDVNGPKGGVDISCRIKVVLSGLPSVVVEERAETHSEAFDRADKVVERAVRRAVERARDLAPARKSTRKKARAAGTDGKGRPRQAKKRSLPPLEQGSLIGRRVGQADENLARAAERPEKRRRSVPVDTAKPGRSASDRRAGGSSTAARNTKAKFSGATAALEDSAASRPSRKSTRRSENRSKRDSNLQRRQVRRARSPQARATSRGG